eukprot:6209369-Pleurochrysis_carterae.AAC.3
MNAEQRKGSQEKRGTAVTAVGSCRVARENGAATQQASQPRSAQSCWRKRAPNGCAEEGGLYREAFPVEALGKAKVDELQVPVRAVDEVLCLDVSVEPSVRVQVRERARDARRVQNGVLLVKRPVLLQHRVELRPVAQLEHQHERVGQPQRAEQIDHERVSARGECRTLVEQLSLHRPVEQRVPLNPLHSDKAAALILHSGHRPKRARAQDLHRRQALAREDGYLYQRRGAVRDHPRLQVLRQQCRHARTFEAQTDAVGERSRRRRLSSRLRLASHASEPEDAPLCAPVFRASNSGLDAAQHPVQRRGLRAQTEAHVCARIGEGARVAERVAWRASTASVGRAVDAARRELRLARYEHV